MAQTQTYTIGNMDCANCAREVETGVAKLKGVESAQVDFVTNKLTLVGDVQFDQLKQRVESLGKTIQDTASAAPQPQITASSGGILGFFVYLTQRRETQFALVGGAIIALGLLLSFVNEAASAIVYTFALAIAAYPIARSGINTLRINREFSINLLMTIAAAGAILIGEHLEAATVIFLFAIGEALEGYTADRARDSLRSLLTLRPNEAILKRDGRELTVTVESLVVGDVIIVKPGERIPMDGRITAGSSAINQAPITGESMPVDKLAGDSVFAGTINGSGALEIEVTHLAADNTLSRIIRMVEEAQSNRARGQRLIERFAQYYTPGVVVLALLVALVPPLLFAAPFYDTPTEQGWLYRALTMLVIACPCALVISTPVTVISAITAAARRGILIKGGVHLETLGTIKAIIFDKTGTLTQGKPVVTNVVATHGNANRVLAAAAAVEQRSAHPLAQAVVQHAQAQQVAFAGADNVETLAGRGVRGTVDERLITVGSHALFDADYPHDEALCNAMDAAAAQGQTTMMVAVDKDVLGYIAVADALRSTSRTVIDELNTLGLTTIMATGDNRVVAQAIGSAAGVKDVRADLMPQDKVTAVKQLHGEYGSVMMVGDGVNDTPALAAAKLGVAMGGAGSAQAMETADVVLMGDDLAQLPFAVRLSRFARSLIWQNVVLSFGMKAAFLLLAAQGHATLWAAIFADVGMSLIVTLNGMRPLRYK
jgi:Zn2+/Cd2+-exporting ATPase